MDTIEFLMDSYVKDTLNDYGHLIETLELSDCYNNVLHKGNNIKITIYLNKLKVKDYENVGKLIEMFFYLIDKLETF